MAPPPAKSLPPIILLPTLFALSIASLVLSIIATRFPQNKIPNPYAIYDFVSEPYVDQTYGWMQNFPDDLRLGSLWAIFGVSFVMVLLTLGFAVTLCSGVHGRESRPNITRSPLVISTIAMIAAVVEFVYSFVQQYTSSTVDVDAFLAQRVDRNQLSFDAPVVGETGSWSLEAWTCQTQEVWELMRFGGYKRTCEIAAAARWLTVPILVVSLVLFAVVAVEFRRRKRAVRAGEERTKGSELSPVQSESDAKA